MIPAAVGNAPHRLGMLRGGEDNTVVGRHREEQKDETLAKLPGALQKALIEDLSKSIAPARHRQWRARLAKGLLGHHR